MINEYMKLNLKRPLVFFDLETTGTNVTKDRIVEISVVKLLPGVAEPQRKTRRVNPEMHIPEGATAVHHITDEMVANEPTFRQISKGLYEFFEGCDIAGYNSNKFDIPLLMEEFARAGLNFTIHDRHLVDVQGIFYKMEPRTLVAAYKFYCGKSLDGAHAADADTNATLEVLMGQLERYPELPVEIEALSEFSRDSKNMDLTGRIVRGEGGDPTFNFGSHKGKTVREVLRTAPGFISWILQSDFPKDTKDLLRSLEYKYKNS